MKITRCATFRAKPISCVTHTIVIPSRASSTITSSTSLIISGSSAEVGSSNSIATGFIDSARAIVDGHIILSRQLAEQGVYPAIDVARSLSRTMADSVDPDHAVAAARFRQLWSAYEENRDLMLMGAYVAGGDPVLDEAIAMRAHQLAFVSQAANAQVDFETSRQALIEGYIA